jgi:hypothetical protein
LIALGWLVVLGLSATLPLSALFQGIIHIGPSSITMRNTLTRPLISIGGNVDLERGSRSMVVVILGDIRLRGHTTDDLVTLDGSAYLTPGSRVDGDVLSILGGIYRGPAVISDGRLGGDVHRWNGKAQPPGHDLRRLLGNSVRLGLAAGLALLLAGTCLTIVFPWQVVLISTTLRGSPVKSLAAGAMILLTFTFLVVPLGLSLAGLPFALLLVAAAALAWLFGMTACAVLVGRLIAQGPVSLLWAAAAGLVATALVMAVPILGPVAVTLTGLIGAGALAVALIARARPATPLA